MSTWISAHKYATTAARLASGERLASHDDRLHANDTVEFIAYRPEYHAYGNPECMTAVEKHFTESSRLALRVLAGPVERGRRAAPDPISPLGFLADAAPPDRRPVADVLLRCTHLLSNQIGPTAAAEQNAARLAARILSDLYHDGEIT